MHDEAMTSMLPGAALGPSGCRRGGASTLPGAVADLEEFWPSRRAHAFDQRCR
jgi:hypothetical protein